VAGAAADVGDVDARLEALDESRYNGQGPVNERGVVDRAGLVVQLFLQARICRVRDAATLPKALNDIALDAPEEREVRRIAAMLSGPAARVSDAACSAGRLYVRSRGS
jgi:hypothetical protein